MLIRAVLALILITGITACSTTKPVVVDTSCRAFKVITYSASHDSAETVVQVREHNAAWRALCQSGKPER